MAASMSVLKPLRLDPAGYRRTPWKNGGGITIDIADAYRPGAAIGGWDGMIWRFGRTRIEQPGPFSDLSGFDRHLMVIEGSGLMLHPAEAPSLDVRRPFHPVSFDGGWRIASELTQGPVAVLNLLADRQLAETLLEVHTAPAAVKLPESTGLIYAPQAAMVALDGENYSLAADATIRIDGDLPMTVEVKAGRVAVACIRLRN
jgi:environmental stress-induced protein Ves